MVYMVLCIILTVCMSHVVVFLYVERVEIRGDCLFCWYWLNRWASLFLLSFHKTIIYITLLRKLKIKQHDTTKQSGVNLVMLRNSKQFLLYYWYPSCTSCLKPGDKSLMKKAPDCYYDERNISVEICDTDIPSWLTKSWWQP
jgi:hypothetical protein